jgi:hypothetical protein
MHVARGLWRVWIAGSAAWIAVVTFDAIYFCANLPVDYQCDPGLRPHLEWALGVPVAVLAASLVLGVAVCWIIAGFRGP